MNKICLLLLGVVPFFCTACFESGKIEDLDEKIVSLNQELSKVNEAVAEYEKNRPQPLTVLMDTVRKNEGYYQVLERLGVERNDRGAIVLALQDSVELSNLRVGQKFHVAKDANGATQVFRFAPNPSVVHLLFKNPATRQFEYKLVEKPLTVKQSIFSGHIVQGGTLHGTLISVGIPARMSGVVAGVLQCKIPFSSVQPGDRFRIMLEESFYKDSIWISGKVLYAEFDGRVVGHHEAFLYNDPDPKSTYNAHYTEKGEALIFDGLRYPLDRLHITSPFGVRIHPVTGARKMHYGIDYGSPTGSPVYAVAKGKVVVSGYDQYSGNKIAIRHADNSTSYYMHLSSRGVGVGAQVTGGQVIGRVGSTGRSTGPHLHLGFKNAQGQWINPKSKTMIATPKLQGERMARLTKQIAGIRLNLEKLEATEPQEIEGSTVKVKQQIVSK